MNTELEETTKNLTDSQQEIEHWQSRCQTAKAEQDTERQVGTLELIPCVGFLYKSVGPIGWEVLRWVG